MERKIVTVTVLQATLGIVVVVAGFAAEATKAKRSQVRLVYYGHVPECHYPSSPAVGLAIAGAVALVLARTIVNSTTADCCLCCQPLPKMPKIGLVCMVITWITYFIAVVLFFVGAQLSLINSVQTDINGALYCYYAMSGLFSAAGIMGLMSVLLGLIYYFLYTLAQRREAAEKLCVGLELKKLTIPDGKKPPTISVGMKPQVSSQKHLDSSLLLV
ncbi:uncharacterized protein LOC118485886 [Helianthus annuus]|uniref:uncharacterized protein LOC118485886 n=1 Tax=Helianthus annuus TaxID=4232 RepID=UPI001652C899|nr:uncharacterized protein LOC118485886 [Helianthus annuus]